MKKIIISIGNLLLLVLIGISLAGCTTQVHAKDLMAGIKPQEVTGKVTDERFVDSQFNLSLKLLKASVKESENENVLVSPLSILLALSMTANGADGQTKSEMESLLGNNIPIEELNEYIYTYLNSLPSNKDNRVKIANSIWFRDNENIVSVNKKFLQTNANYYNAQMYKSPFDDQTLKDINNWCNLHTDGMIKKILDAIEPDDIMFLINALVFDSKWDKPYKEDEIFKSKFTSINNVKQDVEMMRSEEAYYLIDENTEGFIKPYKDNHYSFVALLPSQLINIYDYINGLTKESLTNLLNNAKNAYVLATMPKFSYEYEIRLNKTLKELGMPTAFNPSLADFSKLGKSNLGNIYIGEVLHKTFISVDELGTKAGAVTSVGMKLTSCPAGYKIDLDRPFVYMIIDNTTKLPIFIGVVTEV
ncbi:MAG: serpin family protein [Acholeplasmataceae bacterium]|jgi:serine protease inhibitor